MNAILPASALSLHYLEAFGTWLYMVLSQGGSRPAGEYVIEQVVGRCYLQDAARVHEFYPRSRWGRHSEQRLRSLLPQILVHSAPAGIYYPLMQGQRSNMAL
jgi:hypothetical protein